MVRKTRKERRTKDCHPPECGTREEVFAGKAHITSTGLTKEDLYRNRHGNIASKKRNPRCVAPYCGTRQEVFEGKANATSGGLTRQDLMMSHGRIVSRKKHEFEKKEKRLEKAGYGPNDKFDENKKFMRKAPNRSLKGGRSASAKKRRTKKRRGQHTIRSYSARERVGPYAAFAA
jgi:hypothetical protein